jgi:ketosteroid isomerase-like protein
MATQSTELTREQLAALPASYFKAVDAQDADAVVAHFADDATVTVQTDHVTFNGAGEIHRMFTDFFSNSNSIFHEIKNIVVEVDAQLQLLRRRRRRQDHAHDHLDGGDQPP